MAQEKKIRFKTQFDDVPVPAMPTGTQYDNEYGYVIKENLIKGLEKNGRS